MITRISKIKLLSVVVLTDKGYDRENNHVMVREKLNGSNVISSHDMKKMYQYGKLVANTEKK